MKSDAQWISLFAAALPALLAETEHIGLRWTDQIPESPRGYVYETYEEMRERLRRAKKKAPTTPVRDAFTGAFLYDEEDVEGVCYIVSLPIRNARKGMRLERGDLSVKHKRVGGWIQPELEVVEFVKGQLREVVYRWLMATITREAARQFAARIHEELVAAVWHPRRVARLLEEGGWDAVDALT